MDTPSKIAYTVTADSTGGRAGTSSVPALGITHIMRAPKELGGPGDGANPEALFAMGYGACFQGAMGLAAKELGIDTKDSVPPAVPLLQGHARQRARHRHRRRHPLSVPDRRKNPSLAN